MPKTERQRWNIYVLIKNNRWSFSEINTNMITHSKFIKMPDDAEETTQIKRKRVGRPPKEESEDKTLFRRKIFDFHPTKNSLSNNNKSLQIKI